MRKLCAYVSFSILLAFILVAPLAAQSPRLHIVIVDGENAVNIIQQKTAVSPVVEVRDQNNNPVAGAAVTFAVKGGSAKAALGNGVRQLAVTTDAAGRATVAVNPMTNGSFEIEVNASMSGQTASATISQTNVMNAADAAKAASQGGGHTGAIVTTAVVAGGGIAGYQVYENKKNADEEEISDACGFQGNTATSVPAAGGNFGHTVNLDCTYTATVDQPWVTLLGPTSGTGTGTGSQMQPVMFSFTAQPNTGAARTANIVIKPNIIKVSGPILININQAAAGQQD